MKTPRIYFAEILKLETREEKLAALADVPKHLQAMVKAHLNNKIAQDKWMRR